MSTETETTEKISTEDKILLAERVMGWPPEDYCCTLGVDSSLRPKATFQEPLPPGEIEANRRIWAPEEDTPDGLWQAKRLVVALGWQCVVRYRPNKSRPQDQYSAALTYPLDHPIDGNVTEWAETESEAITLAVLAAAKGADKRGIGNA